MKENSNQRKITLSDVATAVVIGTALIAFLKSRAKNRKLPDGDGKTDLPDKNRFWNAGDVISADEIERIVARLSCGRKFTTRKLPLGVKFYGIEEAKNPGEIEVENTLQIE